MESGSRGRGIATLEISSSAEVGRLVSSQFSASSRQIPAVSLQSISRTGSAATRHTAVDETHWSMGMSCFVFIEEDSVVNRD